MKPIKQASVLAAATALLAVAGCGGGGSSPGVGPAPPVTPAPPPPPTGTNFTAFTRDLMVSGRTNDTDAAVELEAIDWVFTDDDNETTYDDILAASDP